MISPWTIYWITRLDSIQAGCGIVLIVGMIVAFFLGIGAILITIESEWDGCWPVYKAVIRWMLIICVPAMLIGVATPSTKQAVAIYLIPKIANNEQIQQVPENALRLLNSKLEEWIQDSIIRGDTIAEKAGQPKVSTDAPNQGKNP